MRMIRPLATAASTLALALGLLAPAHAVAPAPNAVAPDFTLRGADGRNVRLDELRGQVVLVNFWASWCTECHDEQAALDQTWQRYRDSGMVLLGVDFEDTSDGAKDYVHQSGLTYPVVEDKDSKTALAYGIRGIPETFVIDRTGRIVDRIIGRVDADRLAGAVEPLLKGGTQ